MSRRRGEFEHRTSIFEGAYRAWSHLGGIDPLELFTASASELDPLSRPHTTDSRVTDINDEASYLVIDAQGNRRCYPYEPLPRQGLAHPFIQAIISPWLGPDAEQDDIQLGLTTLRTWWQHRRKGESHSAKQALLTEKLIPVVEGYTRHFFNLAHCGVVNDGDQPPRTLREKIQQLEKEGYTFPERSNELKVASGEQTKDLDTEVLPETVIPTTDSDHNTEIQPYGDPNKTPIVYITENGVHQILLSVTGITCDHCVRIIETVLNGIQGGQSPIQGILSSVGDRELSVVLIKIHNSSMAKRIAYEAIETVKMLGYDGSVMEMSVTDPATGTFVEPGNLNVAFGVAGATDPWTIFDWTTECSCSDHSTVKANCSRHSQMSSSILDAFDRRAKLVREFVIGADLALQSRKQNSQNMEKLRATSMGAQSSVNSRAFLNDKPPSDQIALRSTISNLSPYDRASNVASTSINTVSMQGGIGSGSLSNQGNFNVASSPNLSNLTRQIDIGQHPMLDSNTLLSQYLMRPQHFLNNGSLPIQFQSQSDVGAAMNQESITNTKTKPHNINLMNSHLSNNKNNSISGQMSYIPPNLKINNSGLSAPYSNLNLDNLSLHLQRNMQDANAQMQNQGHYLQYTNPTNTSNTSFSQNKDNRSFPNSTNARNSPKNNPTQF